MKPCIFCKIVKKEIPSQIVLEGPDMIAFKDINPKAKHHVLIVPKTHIDSIMTLQESDQALMGKLIWNGKKIGEHLNVEGYQLRFHVGEKGGQEVFHVHMHFLSDA